MKNSKISKLVLKITDGVLSALIDLVLLNIYFLTESALIGSPGKVGQLEGRIYKDLEKFNAQTIKRAIAKAGSRGFIKQDFTLTKEGRKRLESLFPQHYGFRKWNGKWYLVIYDIPEEKKRERRILRDLLNKLGFGQLQKSVYVSPFNFLGEVKKIIRDYHLSDYVVLAITDKLGTKEARVLANRVWKLNKINQEYRDLLEALKKSNKKDLYFRYLDILGRDPQLPKELLPEDWNGVEAHRLFEKLRIT